MTYEEFKNDMSELYETNGTVNIAVGKLITQITVDNMFVYDGAFQIEDYQGNQLIFSKDRITSVAKDSDGESSVYTVVQDNIVYNICVI